jgi:hypothetical protein
MGFGGAELALGDQLLGHQQMALHLGEHHQQVDIAAQFTPLAFTTAFTAFTAFIDPLHGAAMVPVGLGLARGQGLQDPGEQGPAHPQLQK